MHYTGRIKKKVVFLTAVILLLFLLLVSCGKEKIQKVEDIEFETFALENPPAVLYDDDGILVRLGRVALTDEGDLEISYSVESSRLDALIVRPSKISINDRIVSYSLSQNASLPQAGGTEKNYSYFVNKRGIAYAGVTRIGTISMDISVISVAANRQVCLIPVELKTDLEPKTEKIFRGIELYRGLSVSLELLGMEKRQFSPEIQATYFDGKPCVCILYYALINHGTETVNLVFDVHDDGYSVNGILNNPDYRIDYPSYAGADAGQQRTGSFQILLESGTDISIDSAEIPIRIWTGGDWTNIRIEISREGNSYQVRGYREDGIRATKTAE